MLRTVCRLAIVSALMAVGLATAPAGPVAASHTVDPVFSEYYVMHDGPRVLGPAISERLGNVQYFEKGRLEDHRGTGVSRDWEFMFGRLAADLVEAGVAIPAAGETGPTYGDLHELAEPGRRVQPPVAVDGVQPVPQGVFIPYDALLRAAPGQTVPTDFWTYINNPSLFPAGWLHDIGLPLTPAFQATVVKAGSSRNVLIQAFERTVLTYDAANPQGWQLERANIGVHYLAAQHPPVPGPAPVYPDWKGEYYANEDLSGQPVLVRNDAVIDFDWQERAPGPGVPADHFSIRWTRIFHVDEEITYRFRATVDDGVRIWVADRLIVDEWSDPGRYDGFIQLKPGDQPVRIEYREQTGDATMMLDIDGITSYRYWRGAYYGNTGLSGTPYFVRDDRNIDFNWGRSSPGSGLPRSDFSIRWTRQPSFDAGTYRFTIVADDGVRLYVDGRRVLDKWSVEGAATTYTVDVGLSKGRHKIQLDYRDRGGEAQVKLSYARIT